MITVTTKAYQKILELKKESSYDDSFFLRIDVLGGGCSGLKYNMEFSDTEMDGDYIHLESGLEIRISKRSLLYLAGTELDYNDGLNGKGFQWNNPHASRVCGCGESFSV